MEQRNKGTKEQQNNGIVTNGTMEQWNNGTMELLQCKNVRMEQ